MSRQTSIIFDKDNWEVVMNFNIYAKQMAYVVNEVLTEQQVIELYHKIENPHSRISDNPYVYKHLTHWVRKRFKKEMLWLL